MRLKLLRKWAFIACFIFLSATLKAQSCIPTGIDGSVLNFACNQVCNDLNFQIPHIKSTSSYTLSNIPYTPYPYTSPVGNELTLLYDDDEYSNVINMPFGFCFYDSIFYSFVVGSNGVMTFDISNQAPCDNGYLISATSPSFPGSGGGGQCTRSGPYYPRAAITGNFQDLDPSASASPPGRKIQWWVEGSAPCRKIIVSFYNVGIFGGGCGAAFPNTFQMVLHESTGIVEIFTERKSQCSTSSSNGRGIMGIQDWTWTRSTGISARNPGQWTATNEALRFTPSGGGSRFVKSELFLGATLIATADTSTSVTGLLDLKFPNICPPAGSNQYTVKTTFSACENPAIELVSTDIVTINRTNSLNATATSTNATCGPPDGTITVTVPPGVGTPPFTFILDGGTPVVGPSPHVFTNVAAGLHNIVVTDASAGCTSTFQHTVNQTATLAVTHNETATSCFSVNNGSITISAVAGTGPYTFTLDGGLPQTGPLPFTFSNLTSGVHNLVVNDAGSGCGSGTLIVNIPIGSGVLGLVVMTPTSCVGQNNGTITATALSGTAPYTFILDGGTPVVGPSPHVFTNVAPNLHTVVIRDANGCSNSFPITVGAGPGVIGNATATPTSCSSVNNGTITATATIGTGPFTWSLDGGTAQNGTSPFTFNNVGPGLHTVTITDNSGCSVTVSATVNTGTGPDATETHTATSCTGINDGSATITANAGTPPYTWKLDGGAPQNGASPFTFNALTPGLHTVRVTDVNGCTSDISFTIVAGATPTATATSTATACTGVNNGTITVTTVSIAGPYTFAIDGGTPQAGVLPFIFNNVSPGAHTIVVTGAGGCATSPFTEIVATGPGVSGTTTQAAATCPSASNGSITVNATAGAAPFTYQLDAGAPQSGSNPYTFNNVPAGSHTIIIRDNLGCTFTLPNVIVNAGPALTAATTSAATSCNGASNGSITVTPNGGTAPFTYSIDGGSPVSGGTPFTFNNLAAGNHTIIVTDAAGCVSAPFTENVAAGPGLTTTVSSTAVLCNGGATGTITIAQPSIGTAPFEYSLNGTTWQTGNTFTGLTANTYTAYYRESNGCQGSQPVIITQPAALSATTVETAVVCNGEANGQIAVTVNGGSGPYEYSIDAGGTWQPGNLFTVAANTYTILVRDANGCIITKGPVTVTQPAVLTASSVNTGASCDGGSDGTITVTANGGNAGYQYSIDGANFQASNVFNVTPNTYTVTVKDNLGCVFTFPAVVTLTGNLTYTPQLDATICEGKSTQLNMVSNATSYTWVPATGLSDASAPNPVASPTTPTLYTVTATLGLCTVVDDVFIDVHAAPIPDAGTPGAICYGQSYTLNGSGGTQFLWTPATGLNDPASPNPVAKPVKTTTYTLSIVSDANGCASLITDDVIVDVTPPIKVATFPFDTTAYALDQFKINATTSLPTSFTWSPSRGLSDPSSPNPTVTVGNIGEDVLYQVTAETAAGCKGEGYVRVRIYKGPEIYTPTAFTPNGDGRNDTFFPFPVGIKALNYFRVYNRWGQEVFATTTLNKAWDGKMGGVEQPIGVYVWEAQGITKDNKVITKKGTVTIIR